MRRKREDATRPKAPSSVSHSIASSTSTRAGNQAAPRGVRTLPPWIDSYEDGDETLVGTQPTDRLLPPPARAHPAQHNNTPAESSRRISQDGYIDTYDDVSHRLAEKKPEPGFFGPKEPVKGRKWDHARERDPVIMRSGVTPASSPWRMFIKSTMYGPSSLEDTRRVNEEFLQHQTPGYEQPWRGDVDRAADPEKLAGLLYNKKQRRSFFQQWQHILLMHALIPLIFRIMVLTTSTIALGLSSSVHHLSLKYSYPQSPSTTMAIVVDVVAIPYILYITWDEYTGKPLGLRPAKVKIRLVLLDVFFIIFESANLALAFAALTDDTGSCEVGTNGSNFGICARVKALCGILTLALISWSMTFSVSIFRLVERVGSREEED
ncbi:hypothetical protein G7Y89_g3049 [Cudoniella acicularis]|uniref:Casparian strip membrane protein domain-containing protein n=1 Tax=Cudoniella acicularis TaxID=354080 RepID=A0A8H4W5J8_9HELO|nr:hypothetical protein G7Y89_g3049 [Cudoniella acicularis]